MHCIAGCPSSSHFWYKLPCSYPLIFFQCIASLHWTIEKNTGGTLALQEANAAFKAINLALAQQESRTLKSGARDSGSGDADGHLVAYRLFHDALAAEGEGLSDMVRDVCSIVLPGSHLDGQDNSNEVCALPCMQHCQYDIQVSIRYRYYRLRRWQCLLARIGKFAAVIRSKCAPSEVYAF